MGEVKVVLLAQEEKLIFRWVKGQVLMTIGAVDIKFGDLYIVEIGIKSTFDRLQMFALLAKL